MYIPLPKALDAQNINGYSEEGQASKDAFHAAGRKFLLKLAQELQLPAGTFEVRSNQAGIAVSGEVTLHSDDLYIQLSESAVSRGVSVLYRGCDSRKDYCGHQNHFAPIAKFRGHEAQEQTLRQLRNLLARTRAAKQAKQPAMS